MWIFTGWHRNSTREVFADNSKYLFLHVANNHKNIRPIWISQDDGICHIFRERGFEAYNVHSLRGIYYSLRAKYTIIDAVMPMANWRYSGGSRTIQLWHADGIKKLSFSNTWRLRDLWRILNNPGMFKKFYFLITSSNYISTHFMCPSFGVSEKEVRVTGLPRYDISMRDISGADIDIHAELSNMIKKIRAKNPAKLIFYVPTFRRGKTLSEQLSPLDFSQLDKFLQSRNYYLVMSLHPKFASSNWVPSATYSNIQFSNPGLDQIPLFKEFDLLITDYSSICIDFLFAHIPTIFYIYDIEDYRKNEGLAEEFWGHMPGPRVKNYEELIAALDIPTSKLESEINTVRNELFKYPDGNASERVVQEILKETGS